MPGTMESVLVPFHNMLAARQILFESLNGPIGSTVHSHVPVLNTVKTQYRWSNTGDAI